MRLFIAKNREAMVQTPMGELPLREAVEIIRKRKNVKIEALEIACGMGNRTYYATVHKKYDGVKTFIQALDFFGYDVIIQRRAK
jgi:hypothetical protein